MIIRYVPIVGPIFGSAFIIGLYMLSRLLRGDLTDRMKMMSQVWTVPPSFIIWAACSWSLLPGF
jgi:hypothetical protein